MDKGTTPEELHKMNTMKMAVTFFQRKLQNFFMGTKAADDDLLMLLSQLVDCIEDFVSIAKVIKTNHEIGAVVDKDFFSCENMFECILCGEQTGKTYSSVLYHINTAKHIAIVKEFEQHEKFQSPSTSNSSISSTSPRTSMSPDEWTMLNLLPNIDYEMNSDQTNKQLEKLQPTIPNNTISTTCPEGWEMLNFLPSVEFEMNSNLTNDQLQSSTSNSTISSTCPRSSMSPEEVTMWNFPPNIESKMNSNLTNEHQEKLQSPSTSTITPRTLLSLEGMTLSDLIPNNDIKMPLSQIPFPLLPNHLSKHLQQHRPPLPSMPIARVPIPYGVPINPIQSNPLILMNSMQQNALYNFSNGNNIPVTGLIKNYNQVPPPSQTLPTNYNGPHQMPLYYQRNVVSQNVNQSNDCRKKAEPFQTVNLSSRSQRKKARNANGKKSAEIAKSKKTIEMGRKKKGPEKKRSLEEFELALIKRMGKTDWKVLTRKAVDFLCRDFESELVEFLEDAQILIEENLYEDIAERLIDGCKELNLEVTVKFFGSRINGIGWYGSDIDLNVVAPDCSLTTEQFFEKLAEVLPEQGCWTDGQYVKSRVSFIRACYQKDISCDITFNNVLAMANTRLVQYFYRLQPDCPKLVIFLKMMLFKVNLYPQINTYTINLLVFFFLQNYGYLPKVMDLVETSSLKYWPNEFTEKSLEELEMIRIPGPFKELLVDFMDYYIHNVNFQTEIVSTFTGSTIPKHKFGTIFNPEIKAYYDGLVQYLDDHSGVADVVKQSFKMEMCIQDPFAHDHNVCRFVSKASARRFKEFCEEVSELMR